MTTTAWSTRTRICHILIALLLTICALALTTRAVSAHAALAAATPVPDTIIGQPPKVIRVQLDQSADRSLSQIILIDTSGRTVGGGPARISASDAFLGLAGLGVLLAGLTMGGGFRVSLSERVLRSFRVWGIGTLIAGVIVFGYFSTDRTPTSAHTNPTVNDAATLARGQRLFAQNCAVCHGATGRGDGTLGQQLNPRPANLAAIHAKTHTDGDLYWWVTRGIPGTGMPAYANSLTDQEIWSVIRYLRTFQRSSA